MPKSQSQLPRTEIISFNDTPRNTKVEKRVSKHSRKKLTKVNRVSSCSDNKPIRLNVGSKRIVKSATDKSSVTRSNSLNVKGKRVPSVISVSPHYVTCIPTKGSTESVSEPRREEETRGRHHHSRKSPNKCLRNTVFGIAAVLLIAALAIGVYVIYETTTNEDTTSSPKP